MAEFNSQKIAELRDKFLKLVIHKLISLEI